MQTSNGVSLEGVAELDGAEILEGFCCAKAADDGPELGTFVLEFIVLTLCSRRIPWNAQRSQVLISAWPVWRCKALQFAS